MGGLVKVNPARAGMIRLRLPRTETFYRKPRASGDDPPGRGADPLERDVNPARAGMILPPPVTNRAGARKPRASGDDPAKALIPA